MYILIDYSFFIKEKRTSDCCNSYTSKFCLVRRKALHCFTFCS